VKVSYHTLGCKVNQCDTHNLALEMAQRGYETAPTDSTADIILINTCAVTNESERKCRQLIRKLRQERPDAVLVVTGCYAQTKPEEVRKATDADIVCGVEERGALPGRIEDYLAEKGISDAHDVSAVPFTDPDGRTRAYLKIQDGCKMFCSYCIVPYARQHIACMPVEEIIENVRGLVSAGYKEVVLTGIHIASYNSENMRLIDVLEAVVSQTGIARIRLGSLEPKLLTDEFLIRLAALGERVCPHFHISLQSGSDRILAAMNRRYSAEAYLEICENVRRSFPGAAITTDIIVGFPSETQDDFDQTVEAVRKARFSHVHIFPYSPKRGTPAADYPHQVPNAVKHQRVLGLERICEEVQNDVLSAYTGQTMQVLCEVCKEGFCEGYNTHYIRVRYPSETDDRNRIVAVRSLGHKNGIIISKKIN
jgi:threonylcarbamoyladenosine tRNA methylthiotransferase MtaB